MPLYEFKCPKCKRIQEFSFSINDTTKPLCCDQGCDGIEMEKIISKSSFQFKGSGWFADGYSKKE